MRLTLRHGARFAIMSIVELVFLNGGHMKHQQAPKWLLTTALLAVLGANYGFQASSLSLNKENGSFEMSSNGETSGGRRSNRDGRASVAPVSVSSTSTSSASAPVTASSTVSISRTTTVSGSAQSDKTGKTIDFEREGQVLASGTCADGSCKSVVLELSALDRFANNLVAAVRASTSSTTLVVSRPASAPVTTPVLTKADETEYDCDFTEDGKPETRAQKRDRLRCEKAEKERSKREDRIAKFEDKMESIKDRCETTSSESKLECLTREFNNALTRYTGRNAIPTNVAQRYFKNVVGAELSKMLFNNEVDAQTAMSMLQDVFDGLPSEYGQIRQNILHAIQNETKNRSTAINQQYKLANSFAKQNKPQEYLQAMGEAQAAQTELTQMVDIYSAAARTSDSFSGDVSFAKYYQQTYLPAMRQIFSLMGPTAAAVSTPEKTEGGGTRQNTRSSTSTGTRGQAITVSTKVNETPSQWEFLNSSSTGVRVGIPSTTSRGNTRGARSMSN